MTEKIGIYETLFSAIERGALEQTAPNPLEAEVRAVRVITRRVLKISRGQSDEDQVKTLVLASAVISRLAGLIRTQDQLKTTSKDSRENSIRLMLEDVLAEAQKDWPQL
jgi:hypothetical protein